MTQLLLFALIGLGAGALYAALGIGVVVGFRGTGIINFAAGALAVWSVYVFDELRKTGDLVLPIVVVPHSLPPLNEQPSISFLFADSPFVVCCPFAWGALLGFSTSS